jgi:hypothetical protein
MSGDYQSVVININIFIQVNLTSANRTICVRYAKKLTNYSNFLCKFRELDYGKYTRYSILK